MNTWTPTSWCNKPCVQGIYYPSQQQSTAVLRELHAAAPLVQHTAINHLSQQLAEAAQGQCFILQAGDCAERFSDCTAATIQQKIALLLQVGALFSYRLNKPVLHVGRIAGQYAKPRSKLHEQRQHHLLPCYRGDLINDPAFTLQARLPDPQRLIQAYQCAASTLTHLDVLTTNGFTGLSALQDWPADRIAPAAYHALLPQLERALTQLMPQHQHATPVFTSHEILHLPYAQALTHMAADGRYYNLSTHFPWIGLRTNDATQAHVEYARGIANPIAVKIGPRTTRNALLALLGQLNPDNLAGRLTLIYRLGIQHIKQQLPLLLETVQESGYTVGWCCDPMHGNTQYARNGQKTRYYSDILQELTTAFALHQQHAIPLAGVHLEITSEHVTECMTQREATEAYATPQKSVVDPRLNYQQALALAME